MSLAGAELAASISPVQRIDMVQRGYSPMNPIDVENYLNHKAPSGAMFKIATEILEEGTSTNSFGEKHMSYEKDYQKIAQYFEKGEKEDIDFLDKSNSSNSKVEKINPKEKIKNSLEDYGENNNFSKRGINEKLSEALNKRNIKKTVSSTKNLINMPKNNKEYITEGAQAKNLGYKYGCNYLNAFILNLKSPSSENRTHLIKELNTMILKEESIHSSVIIEYRRGVEMAESELYFLIIKEKKNNEEQSQKL